MTGYSLLRRLKAAVWPNRAHPGPRDGASALADLDLATLRAAVDAADEGVVVTGAALEAPGPQILYVNPAFTRLTGYTAEEAIGATPRILQGPKTDRAVLDRLRLDLAAKRTFRGETVNYRKDGSEFIIDWTITAVCDASGGVSHWIALQRDVTARREAEDALRASERQFRLMADSMPQPVWAADATGRPDYLNDRWYEVTGAPRGEAETDEWVDYVHPDDAEHALRAWNKAVREEDAFEAEYRLSDKARGYRWYLARARPVRNGSGHIIRWVGSSTDIHDVRQMSAALQESEARFRAMADGAPVLIWLAEPDGKRSFFNLQWLKFTGRPPSDILGDRWITDLHPDDQPGYLALYTDHIARRSPFTAEFRLRRADGAWRWMLSSAVPRVSPADGSFAGFVGSATDITDRREAEQQQALLMREVDHRANNVLASVQAVIALETSSNPAIHLEAVKRRLACLARAQGALARNRWVGADLATLLAAEIRAAGLEGVASLHGPKVTLAPHAVQPLVLAVHELAELSRRTASARSITLDLSWSFAGEGLRLGWHESPAADARLRNVAPSAGAAPSDTEKLLAALVRRQLSGSLEWEKDRAGEVLGCTLILPQRVFTLEGPERSPPFAFSSTDIMGADANSGGWLGLFRAAFEVTAVGICVTDDAGRFVLVNHAFCQTVGYSEGELLGWHFSLVVAPEEREDATRTMSAVLMSDDESRTGERRIATRSGTTLTALTTSAVLSIPGVDQRLVVSTVIDVTELHRVQRELKEALAKASAADAAKARFLAAMSHEFRTPIGVILGYSDLLAEAAEALGLPADQIEQIADIRASGRHLLGLVQDILNYARTTSGVTKPAWKQVRLQGFIEGAVRLAGLGVTSPAGVTVRLPDPIDDPAVTIDPGAVRQALVSILRELVLRAGGGGSIDIGWTLRDTTLRLNICCPKLVMDATTVAQLTEPFAVDEDVLRRGLQGADSALALARELIARLGGSLAVTSTQEAGTCVTLVLVSPSDAR